MQKIMANSKIVSKEELEFLRHHMPRGMVSMIVARTKEPRWRVVYELGKNSGNVRDTKIIQAAREILYVVTGLSYQEEKSKRNNH